MYTRIVVPLDGSDLAQYALPDAITLARLSTAPLHLVRVVDPARLDRAGGDGPDREAASAGSVTDEAAEAAADQAQTATRLRAQGLAVTTELRQGTVVEELLAVAQPGDLYVIATHGRTGVTRWLLGSVAEDLARRSVVPVLIVRALVPAPVAARASTPLPVPAVAPRPA